MRNFIKFFVIIIAMTMTTKLIAQDFGIKAGLNLSNVLVKDDNHSYSEDFKMNPGFHVGLTAEFPFTDIFSFEGALLVSTKGFKVSEEDSFFGQTIKYEAKQNLFYIDVPLTGKATFDFDGIKVYGAFGPYIGLGLVGKSKAKVTIADETETEEEDIKWGSDKYESDVKRLDFGLTIGAGVEINAIQVGLTYNLGLANISPYSDGGYKINHRVIGISLGYKF